MGEKSTWHNRFSVGEGFVMTGLFFDLGIRCGIMGSISVCHAEDPGSIPGGGVLVRVGNMGGMRLQCLLWPSHVMTCASSGNRCAVGF
jgi:hypothetical protein